MMQVAERARSVAQNADGQGAPQAAHQGAPNTSDADEARMLESRIFDQAHFGHMTADDVDLQRELIVLFRQQSVLWRRLLIPDAPTHTWRDAAHTVKGSARGLGLWALADACENAEQLAKAGAVEGRWVSDQLEHVQGRLTEALKALARLEDALAAAA
jgi:HPt (histidine-containing phosphotransfer) domain-containing protein